MKYKTKEYTNMDELSNYLNSTYKEASQIEREVDKAKAAGIAKETIERDIGSLNYLSLAVGIICTIASWMDSAEGEGGLGMFVGSIGMLNIALGSYGLARKKE